MAGERVGIDESIEFPVFGSEGAGCLIEYSKERGLPFPIKRAFVITGVGQGISRGGHSLRTTTQILFALSGSCDLELDDGKTKLTLRLAGANKGILLRPHVWRAMSKFSPNTVLLALADKKFSERDYIRDYQKFIDEISKCGVRK